MNSRTSALLGEMLALPPEDRSELLVALIDSLEGEESQTVANEWRDEIRQRKADILAGNVRLVPWSDVRARLLAL